LYSFDIPGDWSMKIRVLHLGKTVSPLLKQLIDEYLLRLKPMAGIEWKELPEPKNASKFPVEIRKKKEAEVFLKHIFPGDTLILLDEKGKLMSSLDFAGFLQKKMLHSAGDLVFVTGGAYGFDRSMYERASMLLSLSPMTFSHQLVRLIFAEQLYRAFSIIHNKPYHNE